MCDLESEACCSWPGQSDLFCSPKSSGCPSPSRTEHPGFTGPEKLRQTGSCDACYSSEVCCVKELDVGNGFVSATKWEGDPFCADTSGGRRCPKGARETTAEQIAWILELEANPDICRYKKD